MLKRVDIVDGVKVNPMQDFLVGQMWVKELQASDKCSVFNAIALISAILRLPLKDFVIDPSLLDASEYKAGIMGSSMLFSKSG